MLLVATVGIVQVASADIDIQFEITNPIPFGDNYTAHQLQIFNEAVGHAEIMWETIITGYQPGISVSTVPIRIVGYHGGTSGSIATGSFTSTVNQTGLYVATRGGISPNVDQIEPYADWQGHGANALNFIDEIIAHETGHVCDLGFTVTAFEDFNGNGAVALGDANRNRVVDATDYVLWRMKSGVSSGALAANSVPEPTSIASTAFCFAIGVGFFALQRQRSPIQWRSKGSAKDS